MKRAIWAANQIIDKPYRYGGGHPALRGPRLRLLGHRLLRRCTAATCSTRRSTRAVRPLGRGRPRRLDHRLHEPEPRLRRDRRTAPGHERGRRPGRRRGPALAPRAALLARLHARHPAGLVLVAGRSRLLLPGCRSRSESRVVVLSARSGPAADLAPPPRSRSGHAESPGVPGERGTRVFWGQVPWCCPREALLFLRSPSANPEADERSPHAGSTPDALCLILHIALAGAAGRGPGADADRRSAFTALRGRRAGTGPAPARSGAPPRPGRAAFQLVDGVAHARPTRPPQVQRRDLRRRTRSSASRTATAAATPRFEDSGYDCSGTVSTRCSAPSCSARRWPRELHALGRGGTGAWITVYTNPGHAFVVIAGLRLDTSAAGDPSGAKGPRWRPNLRSSRGFVARHPLGL